MLRNLFILIIIVSVLLSFAFLIVTEKKTVQVKIPYLKINDNIILVELADKPEEQTKGLSNHEPLKEYQGMLFVFNDKQIRDFWMKDMNFPLDIIWIEDNKIVKISENLPPEGENPKNIYSSDVPVNYVLEVNGGFAQNHNVRIGDKIIYNL